MTVFRYSPVQYKDLSFLDQVSEGDIVIMDDISVLSDDAQKCFEIWKDLFERGADIEFIQMQFLDTALFRTGCAAELLFPVVRKQIAAVMNDRHIRSEKIKTGMAMARKNGRKPGRQKGRTYTSEKKNHCMEVIRKKSKDFEGSLCDAQLMEELGISRGTYYKYKKELDG